ncbi:MAG: LacI family DNA-binding transcriptional regulator [Oscillospiraceae bacterium]|nr:LacI family DNA-binding transcriptional regulator [Oscillospiraceae bacterium]
MVTIEQVAKYAGVSVATVSRTLNNSPTVKPLTAKRVREAIVALNYTPNQSARNLRRNESRVILALAPNFSNPYYSHILTGIGEQAREREYSVLICNTSGLEESERSFMNMLETRRADGAIILGCNKDNKWLAQYADRFPVVLCCEYVPELECPSVSIDNYKAARDTVAYLQSLGHRRIAMLGADNRYISSELRLRGYMDSMAAAGIDVPEGWYQTADGDYSFASGQRVARRLLSMQPRPSAVFCVSDILALSVISVAQSMGIDVPGELTVTGFDDVDYTTMFRPHLTTVYQPCYEMGRQSVKMVLDIINGEENSETGRRFVPHKLVCRESSAELE